MMMGGSFGDKFDRFAKSRLNMSSLQSLTAEVKRLRMGRSDFLISDFHDTYREINDTKTALKAEIVVLPWVIATNPVYFAMSRHSACAPFSGIIFATLQQLLDDKAVQQIAKHHQYPIIQKRE